MAPEEERLRVPPLDHEAARRLDEIRDRVEASRPSGTSRPGSARAAGSPTREGAVALSSGKERLHRLARAGEQRDHKPTEPERDGEDGDEQHDHDGRRAGRPRRRPRPGPIRGRRSPGRPRTRRPREVSQQEHRCPQRRQCPTLMNPLRMSSPSCAPATIIGADPAYTNVNESANVAYDSVGKARPSLS